MIKGKIKLFFYDICRNGYISVLVNGTVLIHSSQVFVEAFQINSLLKITKAEENWEIFETRFE